MAAFAPLWRRDTSARADPASTARTANSPVQIATPALVRTVASAACLMAVATDVTVFLVSYFLTS